MMIFYSYVLVAMLFAAWMGWHMHQTLDKFDWAYRRSDIWVSFGARIIFWPLVMILKPATFVSPKFGVRPGPFNIDLAERARQRLSFMENPPPCGSTVIYRTFRDDDEKLNAIFYFSAANVQAMAERIGKEHQSLEGMYAAARWTSLRNELVFVPTEVPDLLVNFDNITEDLIESNHGQVFCQRCNKVYSLSELTRKVSGMGVAYSGWIYASFMCPARHSLLFREVMHIMRRRSDE